MLKLNFDDQINEAPNAFIDLVKGVRGKVLLVSALFGLSLLSRCKEDHFFSTLNKSYSGGKIPDLLMTRECEDRVSALHPDDASLRPYRVRRWCDDVYSVLQDVNGDGVYDTKDLLESYVVPEGFTDNSDNVVPKIKKDLVIRGWSGSEIGYEVIIHNGSTNVEGINK